MLHARAPFEVPEFLRARVGDEPFVIGGGFSREPLAASHDGRLVAGALGPLVWVANADDGVIARYLVTEARGVDDLRFSRDDARLFAIGHQRVTSWRLADGQREVDLNLASTSGRADLSPDQSRIFVDSHNAQALLDVATGAVVAEQTIPGGARFGDRPTPVFTTDGRFVAVSDAALAAWDMDSHAVTSLAAQGPFSHVCAVGDGAEVIAAGPERLLFRYDLADGRWIASGRGPRVVHALLVDGRSLWVCGADRADSATWALTVCSADSLEPIPDAPVVSIPRGASVARRGETLFVTCNGRLTVTPIATAPSTRFDAPVRAFGHAVRIDPTGARVCASFGTLVGAQVVCWTIGAGERIGTLSTSRRHPLWLSDDGAFAPDDTLAATLAAADARGDATHVLAPRGEVLAVRPNDLAVLPDGPTFPLPRALSRNSRYAWQRDDALVLGVDFDRVSAFDLRTGESLPPRSFSGLRAVAPLGETAWVVTDSGAQRWDFRARTKLRAFKPSLPAGALVEFAAASRDGRRLAIGTASGALVLIELDGAGRTMTFQGARAGGVSAGAFSDDGALLATVGNEPCVRVWDVDAVLASAPAEAPPKRRARRSP